MLTLVSAFFRLRDRSVDEDEQFRRFDQLAAGGAPILLFLDRQLADRAPSHPNVRVELADLDALWPFQRKDDKPLPAARTPEKDTRDFLLLQNAKLDLLASARKLDDSSTHFAWIDFGVMKVAKNAEGFLGRLRTLDPPPSCVLAPGCWSKEQGAQANGGVNWRFCGGFILADRESIPALVARYHSTFNRLKQLTWEVNVWAEMERKGQRFDWYKADHDDSLVDIPKKRTPAPAALPARRIFLGVPCFAGSGTDVASALRSFCEPTVQVLAIDNGATDEVRAGMKEVGDAVSILRNERNIYVNPAWNQIAKAFLDSGAQLLVVANSDVLATRGWSKSLWMRAERARRENLREFWFARRVGRQEVERGIEPSDEVKGSDRNWPWGESAGAFFAMTRAGVEAAFPVPDGLRIFWGDDWLFNRLIAEGYAPTHLRDMLVHHIENVSVRSLPPVECKTIAEADHTAWNTGLLERSKRKGISDWGRKGASGAGRICLNMIVKNERAIIDRCLEAALPYIDTWAILDTGSTDGTGDAIEKFFADRKIPGKLGRSTFRDFAQARNEALDLAHTVEGWDYALLIDADMVMQGSLDKSALSAPAYKLLQRDGALDYWNTRLVRRTAPAHYVGVTHEFLSVEGSPNLDALTIDDRNDGGSKSDKGERDIRLLNEGLAAEPQNERYMFYLANTYREMGRHAEAVQWYRRRIQAGGWDEEVWASHYGIARCHAATNDEPALVLSCFDAYNFRPSRAEPLSLLARWWREHGKNDAAVLLAEQVARIPCPTDILFLEREVYERKNEVDVAISGYYSKLPARRQAGYDACARLTIDRDAGVRDQARKNFVHYAKSARELFGAETRAVDWRPDDGYAPMNPSVLVEPGGRRLVLVRTVNYKVADGQYPTVDGSGVIRTRNWIVEMNEAWRPKSATPLVDETGLARTNYPVEGFEDCRLYVGRHGRLNASATVRDLGDGRCEMAVLQISAARVTAARVVRDYEHDRAQKNWMPILGKPGWFLYLCDPTTVIDCSAEATVVRSRVADLDRDLTELRGGSQVIPHGDGWLCLVHEVVHTPGRVYLHRFVRLNAQFEVTVVTEPFYFEHKGIEFVAGLARDGDRLVASYGVDDASAHLAFFDTAVVDKVLGA